MTTCKAAGDFSHTPFETLRQDALEGNWKEAQKTCCALELTDSTERAVLDLIFAVWSRDTDAVGAAVAKIERPCAPPGLASESTQHPQALSEAS